MNAKECTSIARISSIEGVVHKYSQFRRSFLAELERCTFRGWPDKKHEIEVAFRLQNAYIDRELLRFCYLNQVGEFPPGRWKLLKQISDRLNAEWSTHDELELGLRESSYTDIVQAIEQLKASYAATSIGNALHDVEQDKEAIKARDLLFSNVHDLNKELAESWNQ